MKPVSFGVVGVGGYAKAHIYAVETLEKEGLGKLSAVVVRNPDKYRSAVEHLTERGVRIYRSYEDMLGEEADRIEVVTLPVGIPYHKEMTIAALEAGFNVIVEKPPAVTIQDIDEMLKAERESSRFCAVGFQSQSENTVRTLKRRICEGRLGEIREVVVKGRWKRLDSYYERNAWAGKFMHNGRYVLDGTICNPLAHYLMNGLYFASTEWGEAANPVRVRAELYRGHRIEGEDTSCLEVETEGGSMIYFFATLCAPRNERPHHEIVGSEGVARWTTGGDVYIEYRNGESEVIRYDERSGRVELFRNAARYLRGVDGELNCPLELTRPFVLALNGAYESSGTIRSIPEEHLIIREEEGSISTTINNIVEIIDEAFRQRRLYSDLGVEWAHPTEYFDLRGYRSFNMRL
ncbi:gfo/Idh/MocA family oxidoreductase [Candidatus Bathyarchaeota archaeon]|nr:MAG: gfo/Idh/MocA family oxidoreductase [Candidatus Bathyarchaeota archaeon]